MSNVVPIRKPAVESLEPLRLAEFFLQNRAQPIRRWRDSFWTYDGSCYRRLSDEVLDAEVYEVLDGAVYPQLSGDKLSYAPVKPKRSMVAEVRAALPSRGLLLDSAASAPMWLDGSPASTVGLVVVRNGLLDLASGRLTPATPELFATHALPVEWHPDAPAPAEWLTFLATLWPDDPQSIAALQEWMGLSLVPDTSHQKIVLIVGPRRSGKGTVARVHTALLGSEAVAAPTLGSLTGNFGLQALLDRQLAIISDARLSGRADQAVIAERLLSISGEDSILVDRKHMPAISVRLPVRFAIMTNELPRLADASGALASRFLVLTLSTSFYGREDHGLTDRLLAELPSILVWAVQGWRRLHERGRFVQPESGLEAIREIEDLGSPVGAFVRDCCAVDAAQSVHHDDLFSRWRKWCAEQGRDHAGTAQTFARDLRAVVPGLQPKRWRFGSVRVRGYQGIGLRTDGGDE